MAHKTQLLRQSFFDRRLNTDVFTGCPVNLKVTAYRERCTLLPPPLPTCTAAKHFAAPCPALPQVVHLLVDFLIPMMYLA
jgi:hypothetical protein